MESQKFEAASTSNPQEESVPAGEHDCKSNIGKTDYSKPVSNKTNLLLAWRDVPGIWTKGRIVDST